AEVLLHPTTSVTLAQERLWRLPTGGTTPFADGLHTAWQIIKTERAKDPDIQPLLVVISDGDANVGLGDGQAYIEEICALARQIRQDRIRSVAIDTKPLLRQTGEMLRIAQSLDAKYHPIDRLRTKNVVEAVREAENHRVG
ncbi:MAG: magnesium chelatase, partial [bacterium]